MGIILDLQDQMRWGKKNKPGKEVDWGMLISHHPPCQYDRTFCLFKIRVCTRCTGVLSGIIFSVILIHFIQIKFKLVLISTFLLPIPAILNFTLTELKKLRNNGFKRFSTGALLGIVLGYAINQLIIGRFFIGILIILWFFILEMVVTIVLQRANILDDFFKKYEDGVYKKRE